MAGATAVVALLLSLLAGAPRAVADGFGDVGYEDASFSPGPGNITGEKPESKLWWNDGSWWASMVASAAGAHHIFRLDGASQTWVDTGVVIDPRDGSRADVLWDEVGQKLYVASHAFASPSGGGSPAHLYRFSYDTVTSTYTLDAGFPATINTTSTETLVLGKDGKGQLWATWVQGSKVYVNRSLCQPTCNDATWGTPFVPSVNGTSVTSDDISSLVAVGGDIGLMWSNQSSISPGPRFLFAIHDDVAADGTWQSSVVVASGPGSTDDHINLHVDDSGSVYAALKTSRTGASEVLTELAVRSPDGTWSLKPYGTFADHHTRPIVVIDEANQMVHMFATSSESGGTIYRKSSPLAAISFPPGLGEPFIRDASDANLNNATSSKQNVDAESGLLVLASNGVTERYWHNLDPLDGSTLPGNSAPTAATDLYSTVPNTPLIVAAPGVLGNDIDDDGDALTATKVSDPASGSASVGSNGAITYTPAPGFTGTVTFHYEADDGRTASAPGTVSIQVGGGASPYTATVQADGQVRSNQPDSTFGSSSELRSYAKTTTLNDSFVRFSVTGGAGVVESATLRLFVTDGSPSGGSVFAVGSTTWSESGLTWNNRPATTGSALASLGPVATGSWVEVDVTSVVSSNGGYSFSVQGASSDLAVFSSKEGAHAPQLVITATTTPVPNTPPVAVGEDYPATAGVPLLVAAPGVLGNDTDVDGDVLTPDVVSEPENGSLSMAPDGSFTYAPADGFAGGDAFTYRAFDGEDYSGVVNVGLTVTQPNPTTTSTFAAVADSHVRSNQPTSTLGSSTELRSYLRSTTQNDSFVRFSVTGGGGAVQSATLRLFVTDASPSGGSVFAVGSPTWSESGLTWNNRPGTTGSALASLGPVATGSWVEIDVTSVVGSNGDYAFSVQGASSDLAVFSSKEGTNAPQLVVTRAS